MEVDRLLREARSKVSARTPRYIDLDEASDRARQDVQDMVAEKLRDAMEQAVLGAQSILKSTCQEYIDALHFTDDLRIGIRSEAAHLEYGYGPRDMKDSLLSSSSAKQSADGGRYAIIPIGDKPPSDVTASVGRKVKDIFQKGKEVGASTGSLSKMVEDMRSKLRRPERKPSGYDSKEFRTVTDKEEQSWVHPGFQGVNQLEFINETLRVALIEGAVRILETEVNGMRR